MNIWKCDNWKQFDQSFLLKSGLSLHFDHGVDPDLRRSCIIFCRWLRKEYCFPIHVNIYVKKDEHILTMNGELAISTCWRPTHKEYHSYIRVATGDYLSLVQELGRDRAIAANLYEIARMLTHYYQWLNDAELSERQEVAQATQCARIVLRKYAQTRDHP